jgi:uncharacterized membrane protein
VRDDAERNEYERAAIGYLVWPSSLLALARESPAASNWTRIHTRQAAMYGLVVTLAYVVLLAVPLFVVIGVPSISTGTTVLVYTIGIAADLVVFVALVAATLACASRASRGELFSIPVVSSITDRVFRLRR